MDFVMNVDKVISLVAASFAAYYITLEILDWFKVFTEGKPKKEMVIQSITPIVIKEEPKVVETPQTDKDKLAQAMAIIEELKNEVALQTTIPTGTLKQDTPDLSDIKLPGLTTKVEDKVVNL